eukprot:scaffold589114_cov25-Prasinocladus_malaysianus.AAC.1
MACAGSDVRVLAIPDVLKPVEINRVLCKCPVTLLFCTRDFFESAANCKPTPPFWLARGRVCGHNKISNQSNTSVDVEADDVVPGANNEHE